MIKNVFNFFTINNQLHFDFKAFKKKIYKLAIIKNFNKKIKEEDEKN